MKLKGTILKQENGDGSVTLTMRVEPADPAPAAPMPSRDMPGKARAKVLETYEKAKEKWDKAFAAVVRKEGGKGAALLGREIFLDIPAYKPTGPAPAPRGSSPAKRKEAKGKATAEKSREAIEDRTLKGDK